MSTSLAEQLRRLATPQTSQLKESKKRASILFDAKDAATKDRETIFDIGQSGLHELIALNPSFLQFEQTLFDRTTKEFERSVESSEVNKLLNKSIKKFLLHLSPYFLLQPAHKCLEWLIRRFHIHEYNKNDLMSLILPYHSTRMFVKCIQIMPLRDPNDPWHWLDVLKKPGIPLAKQTLFNRAASDNFLLKFICKFTLNAVKELESKAYTLQTMFAFFCTTILGVLDTATEITDSHVSNIYQTVIKGLTSNVIDFCASSLMITGHLVSKTSLSLKFLDIVVLKLAKITHPAMQLDATILLILIYKSQEETIKRITDEQLKLFVANRNIAGLLEKVNRAGVNILPFYLAILAAILQKIQNSPGESLQLYMDFCENLLIEVVFTKNEAADIIKCILNSYIIPGKAEDDVITIESDEDEDVNMDDKKDINLWYSELLKKVERQYPQIFDRVTKEIMTDQQDISNQKKKSLKTILGFLFTTACSDDGTNIFENLYHYNARSRISAVKHLVKNLEKMSFSDDSKDLLKDSISERLNDDSPLVVCEVLKFKTSDLVRLVGDQLLVEKLKRILTESLMIHEKWDVAAVLALKHITSKLVWKNIDKNVIFLSVFPFLFLPSKPIELSKIIINSEFAKHNGFLQNCAHNNDAEDNDIRAHLHKQLKHNSGLPNVMEIIKIVNETSNDDLNVQNAYHSLLLLSHTIPDNCDIQTRLTVLDIVIRMIQLFKMDLAIEEKYIEKNKFPLRVALLCIERIFGLATDSNWSKKINFDSGDDCSRLMLKIHETLIDGLFTSESIFKDLYANTMNRFLNLAFPDATDRMEFYSNYFIAHVTNSSNIETISISPTLQIRSIRFYNNLLIQLKQVMPLTISLSVLVRILYGLCSHLKTVRFCAFETLEILNEIRTIDSRYISLIKKLLQRKEELLLDKNQLALILFRIFNSSKSQETSLLNDLIDLAANLSQPKVLRSIVLDILQHVNNTIFLNKVAPTVLEIFSKVERVHATDKPILLDPFESTIVKMFIYRYNSSTVSCLKSENSSCWNVIVNALKLHNLMITVDEKPVTVCVLIMNTFVPDLFDELFRNNKREFIDLVIMAVAVSENPDIVSAASKFMKKIEINGEQCLPKLELMKNVEYDSLKPRKRRSKTTTQTLSTDTLNSLEWKCGIVWLEYLQNKKRLSNAHVLIPCLFDILKKCTEIENQSATEYAKQLTLSCILHCCQIISPHGEPNRKLLPDKLFKIDLIVQCIRSTPNPQTHHNALQLLSRTAAMIPEKVLFNMMEIFTFVGSTVIRRDDAYTYQIISSIIKSIIPTLIKANENASNTDQDSLVIPVLRVFSDIILDVPEHRRIRLYMDLMRTLNATQYLWMFLVVLFESHVRNYNKEDDTKRILIAVDLVNKFECNIAIETCSKLIEFLHKQPFVVAKKIDNKMDVTNDSCLFQAENCNDKELRHFRYSTLQFISHLTKSSSKLTSNIALLPDDAVLALKPFFKDIIVKALQFLGKVKKTGEQQNTRYWNTILHYSFDILEQIMSLLSPDMLLQVITGLLNNIPEIRRKAIELLNKKLQLSDFFSNCETSSLLVLLDPLSEIVESIIDESKLCVNATPSESVALQQHALIAIKLLSINLASDNPTKFSPILVILSTTIKSKIDIPLNVLGQVVLCLAEVCSNLRAHSVSHLPKFMPALGKHLQKQVNNVTVVLTPTLAAIYKIIETLPLFLSPYMINIIVSLSEIWSRLVVAQDIQKKIGIINKLEAIWSKLATVLSMRVLVPMVDQSFNKILEEREYAAIGPLMKLLTESFSKVTSQDVAPYQNDLTSFFIKALQIRSNPDIDIVILDAQEAVVIQALVGMILKLSESSFRPFYYKINEWALKDDFSVDSAITFFRLSSKISDSLKSLFVLFANEFIQNAADLLIKYTNSNVDNVKEYKVIALIESIIQTLHNVFLYDSQGFINSHRFDILMQPIVDQLDNEIVLANKAVKDQIPLCLAELAKAANDDVLWKQLNYQILLKTRNNNPDIRIFGLKTCIEVAKKLESDFQTLLPETIPFLAELMEDEHSKVEKQCVKSVQELEGVLGESLQKYF